MRSPLKYFFLLLPLLLFVNGRIISATTLPVKSNRVSFNATCKVKLSRQTGKDLKDDGDEESSRKRNRKSKCTQVLAIFAPSRLIFNQFTFEEIFIPKANDFIYIPSNFYSTKRGPPSELIPA